MNVIQNEQDSSKNVRRARECARPRAGSHGRKKGKEKVLRSEEGLINRTSTRAGQGEEEGGRIMAEQRVQFLFLLGKEKEEKRKEDILGNSLHCRNKG